MATEERRSSATGPVLEVMIALHECGAGPERFAAVDPSSVDVTWESAEHPVPGDRRSKLIWVYSKVSARVEMHQMPQVLIVDETGVARTLLGHEYGTFDPATVFGTSP